MSLERGALEKRIGIWVLRIFAGLFAGFSLYCLMVFSTDEILHDSTRLGIVFGGLAAAGICLLVARLSAAWCLSAAMTLIGTIAILVAYEVYLGPPVAQDPVIAKLVEADPDFDLRPVQQAVIDGRGRTPDLQLDISPVEFRNAPLMIGGKAVFPFGKVPLAPSLTCNESGVYHRYHSDRFGFDNPDDQWRLNRNDSGASRPRGILLIGDSFAQGHCVPFPETPGARLRAQFGRSVRLGRHGAGSLFALGSLKEYGAIYKPETIVWFFYEGNDFDDLAAEFGDPILRRYLDSDFSQSLAAKSPQIGMALRQLVQAKLNQFEKRSVLPFLNIRHAIRVAQLSRRVSLEQAAIAGRYIDKNVAESGSGTRGGSEAALGDRRRLEAVAELIKFEALERGAALLMVFLPAQQSFPAKSELLTARKKIAVEIAKRQGIRFLDIEKIFRATSPNPLKYFQHAAQSHYSIEGYRLVMRHVSAVLTESGSVRSPLPRGRRICTRSFSAFAVWSGRSHIGAGQDYKYPHWIE